MHSLGLWDELADALRDELAEYGGLLGLLDEQRQAIVSRKIDALLEANERVHEQAATANRYRLIREALCARLAESQAGKAELGLAELVAYMPPSARPLFEALTREATDLIAKARDKSQRNSALLARAGELNEKVIAVVRPGSTTKTYTARGNVYLKNAHSRGNGLDLSA
ncbi:MAG: flagellar protein FlgN [Opitutales bacterium]|nr:flagellar protein FlgN [Opitutales bacterium]